MMNQKIDNVVNKISEEIIKNYQNHLNDDKFKNDKFIVCLAGAPASGKSTISELLIKDLNKKLNSSSTSASSAAVIIPMDGYHLDNSILKEKGLLDRKGSPPTFDSIGFLHMLNRLKQQGCVNDDDDDEQPIYIPTFDRNLDLSIAGSFKVETFNKILIVEGNYLLLNQQPWCQLKKLFNLSIFIKVELPILEKRLIERWTTHGFNLEGAMKKAHNNDIPNAEFVSNNSNLENTLIIENNDN